jgi:hypothetical protein
MKTQAGGALHSKVIMHACICAVESTDVKPASNSKAAAAWLAQQLL